MSASYDAVVSYRDPLSSLVELDGSVTDRDQRRFEAIAACMSEKGFEYRIDQYPKIVTERVFASDLPPFQRDWIEKYGYGIAAGFEAEGALESGVPSSDQNEYPSQSDGERVAYSDALRDCEKAIGPREFARPEFDEIAVDFADELADLRDRVNSDRRIVAFDEQLARCVELQGVSYLTPSEAERFFIDKVIEIEERHGGPTGVDWTAPEVQVELDGVRTEEIRHALITYDCGGGLIARQAVVQQVTTELYEEFLDQNRSAIEEILSG